MELKKGGIVTVIILIAIAGASFLVYLLEDLPQNNETTFVVSNYKNYLDSTKNVHEVLHESVEIEYQNLRNGKISANDYITIVEITSSQVTAQITEFVISKPPEEWQSSYINYMNAMKKFNQHIGETKVLANLIEKNGNDKDMKEVLEKIDSLKIEYQEFVRMSDETRPN
jgi:uncharacterized protein (UPF0333 family)